MKYKDRKEKREVNDILSDLLCPLKNHTDDETTKAIDIALQILEETEVDK